MKKNIILKFIIFSGIFVMILGTLLHFTYEWSGNNTFVAAFSAVNESTWEHLKLLFYPMFLTTIIGYFYLGKTSPNFVAVILGELVSYKVLVSSFDCNSSVALVGIILLLACFIIFTYFTPEIGLFKDPVTGLFGIIK